MHQKSLDIKLKVFGPDHLVVAETQGNIAGVYYRQGKHTKALELYKKELAVKEKAHSHNHPHVADTKVRQESCNLHVFMSVIACPAAEKHWHRPGTAGQA